MSTFQIVIFLCLWYVTPSVIWYVIMSYRKVRYDIAEGLVVIKWRRGKKGETENHAAHFKF